ncbi:MAG: L,D-transpeptidase/peptidoglycan binding protein [Thermoleophilia bacterium]|nr:L,D-transpeptidase/peptidoglycan binding protein [Thermoleophilia bacterium]
MRFVRKTLVRLGVVLFAATIACAAAPAADEAGSPIARGVRVGDVVLAGLTTQPARERLRRELARPLRIGDVTVATDRFGLSVDVDAAARAALAAAAGESIPLSASVNDARIRRFVAGLAPRYFRAPVDASVTGLDARLRPTYAEGRPGRRLDRRALERAIRGALLRGERRPVRLRFARVLPDVMQADLAPVIVIRRESNTLTLFDGRKQVRVFRVATGLPQYPTPLGRFDVVDKQYHPWWYPPPSDWAKGLKPVPPGPSNPLGTRWMGLSAWGVGIHGTPSPASIGYSASHGCIRMYVPDAEWLFERVELGTPVFIVSA